MAGTDDPAINGIFSSRALSCEFEAEITTVSPEGEEFLFGADGETPVLDTGGFVQLKGRMGLWSKAVRPAWNRTTAVFAERNFEITDDVDGSPAQSHPRIRLLEPLVLKVDLSRVKRLDLFWLNTVVSASTAQERVGEGGSGTGAFLRDPTKTGGAVMKFTGLRPINAPRPSSRAAPPAAPCARGTDPAAGALQFSAPGYALLEGRFGAREGSDILVTRTQGSKGAVSATFGAGGGTAVAGVHYSPLGGTVHFADGDPAPRSIGIDLLQNGSSEPDTTLQLTLSNPGGCATIGAQAGAVLTILDDDLPAPPPSFTIGGTVSGLVGSGLRLEDLRRVPITVGNGPFTFTVPTTDGQPYAVSVVAQPANALQICTVSNGSGTVAGANVTNVAVNCTTPSANSALDLSFGSAGKVTSPGSGFAAAVAVQADGKIVTAGGGFTLTRHNADGSPDAGFGTLGRVNTVFNTGASGTAADVAIQPDGKIVVAGRTRDTTIPGGDNFGVRRYNADGSPDTGFGTLGLASVDFAGLQDEAFAVALQSDGKIVVAGTASSGAGVLTDLALARLNSNGSVDASFGKAGKQLTDVAGGFDSLADMVIQPDDKIVVLGNISNAGSNIIELPALVRYSSTGIPDASFGTLGKVIDVKGQPANALALQADGKIVVGGASAPGTINSAFAVKRYLADGQTDNGFGTAGLVSTPFAAGSVSSGRAVAVQADGKIVLAGETSGGGAFVFDIALVRYTPGGQPDASFGTAGILTVDFFAGRDFPGDIAIQPDGKAVVVGSARNGVSTDLALLRTNP